MYKILNSIVINLIVFSLLFSGVALAEEQKVSKDNVPAKKEITIADSKDREATADIELISERSDNSKSYLMKDGSTTVVISAYSVHYEKDGGQWADINPILVNAEEASILDKKLVSKQTSRLMEQNKRLSKEELTKKAKKKSYVAPYVPFTAEIPHDITDGYTMGKDADAISFIPVNASPSFGVLNNRERNSILYSNVWENTDLELSILSEGIKETLYVSSPDSPSTFSFKVSGNLQDDFSVGSLQLLPAWVEDADGKFQYVDQTIRTEGNQKYIDIHIPKEQLRYPIVIDPTVVTVGSFKDTHYNFYNPQLNNPNIGMSDTLYLHNHYKALMQFDTSFIPSNAVIKSAELKLKTGMQVDIVGPPTVTLNRVTSHWDEYTTTPNNAPTYSDWIANINIEDYVNPFGRVIGGTIINVNLTSAVSNWVSGYWPNFGFIIHWSGPSVDRLYIQTKESYIDNRPKLIINYNVPSTKPLVTYPNGGEVLDGAATIYWNAASDPDNTQNTIKYQVQLSTNGGGTWTDIIGLTGAGVTQHFYDFSSIPATNNALIRIRAFDGDDYGEWDQSDAFFTIKHNQAPLAPTGLTPGSPVGEFISGASPVLNWTFQDPDAGDTQTAYQVEFYKGQNLINDSGWINSSVPSYMIPITMLPDTLYGWRVRTKDSYGAVSNFSNKMNLKANSIPSVSFSSYSNGQSLPNNNPEFTWLYSDAQGHAQAAYKIQGSTDNWTNLMYDSGIVTGSALSHQTPALANGEWDFRISVFDGLEWSAWAHRINLKLPNSFEPNDTSATAYPVLYNNNYSTLISSSTDVDWFVYSPNRTGVDEVHFNVPSGLNYDIFVYDKDLNLVASGQRDSSGMETLLYKVSSGPNIQYFIKVVGAGGQFSATSTYTLSVKKLGMNFQTIYQYDDNGNITSKTTTIIN